VGRGTDIRPFGAVWSAHGRGFWRESHTPQRSELSHYWVTTKALGPRMSERCNENGAAGSDGRDTCH
jgi:hypothetical protein